LVTQLLDQVCDPCSRPPCEPRPMSHSLVCVIQYLYYLSRGSRF
jgi:hypothetical protein